MLEFSWIAFNVHGTRGGYADWIDRGRPSPYHRDWADYLRWVAERLELTTEPDLLTSIGLTAGRWLLTFESGRILETDGVVITSPGPPKKHIEIKGDRDAVFNGRSFWSADGKRKVEQLADRRARACVIGSGETAAAIVAYLAHASTDIEVDIVSREGIVFTRGESYEENRFYSDPRNWQKFPPHVRRKFVSRTDRGVFSPTYKATINECGFVKTISGSVEWVEGDGHEVHIGIDGAVAPDVYELVVDATGFARSWFLDLMERSALDALIATLGPPPDEALWSRIRRKLGIAASGTPTDAQLVGAIGDDLAVEGFAPFLHLPMFAAIERGPGFPNLGCLGTLADRILVAYTGRDAHG